MRSNSGMHHAHRVTRILSRHKLVSPKLVPWLQILELVFSILKGFK